MFSSRSSSYSDRPWKEFNMKKRSLGPTQQMKHQPKQDSLSAEHSILEHDFSISPQTVLILGLTYRLLTICSFSFVSLSKSSASLCKAKCYGSSITVDYNRNVFTKHCFNVCLYSPCPLFTHSSYLQFFWYRA